MKKSALVLMVLAVLIGAPAAGAHLRWHHRHHHRQPPVAVVYQVDRAEGCASGLAYRVADKSYGEYVDVSVEQLNSGTYTDALGKTFSVVPAAFGQGYGLTCDNLAGLGYKDSGYKVDGSGTIDTAAPQFNIYEYWTAPATP